MSVTIKSNGNLEQLKKNLAEVAGTTQVKLVDLMPSQFVSNCSKFASLEELFQASGFKVESPEDFAAIPDDEWDAFIKENTTYANWLEMQKTAHSEYAAKYLKVALAKGMK